MWTESEGDKSAQSEEGREGRFIRRTGRRGEIDFGSERRSTAGRRGGTSARRMYVVRGGAFLLTTMVIAFRFRLSLIWRRVPKVGRACRTGVLCEPGCP
eukprot:2609948-Prymnesium_polylepis.1